MHNTITFGEERTIPKGIWEKTLDEKTNPWYNEDVGS